MIDVKRKEVVGLVAVDRDSPIPLAAQLAQQISWLIASRVIEVGEKLPAIRDLAERVGVNLHTVRAAYQYLEGDGLVQVQRGRGTTVLPADRWRTSGREAGPPTSTIGIIIPTHAAPIYAPFLSGIESGTPGSSLAFVCDAQENPELGLRYFDQLVAKKVDGVIVAGPMIREGVVSRHQGRHPPLVCADYPTAPGPVVEFDLDGASRSAVEHLIAHGHKRIGLISPPVALTNVRPRVDAYRRTLAEAGLSGGDDLIAEVGDWSANSGGRGLEALLALKDPPTAVVAAADVLAIGALRSARARGVAVPVDLALVGIDNSGQSEMVDPPLTSVDLSPYQLGRLAVEMLGQLIAGTTLDEDRRMLPFELVVRESCGSH